ncbi:MAG: DinB family protein, partial [Candidatus Zixiibacteriota bacterium]
SMASMDVMEPPSFGEEPEAKSRKELMQTLGQSLSAARETLSEMDDEKMKSPWTLKKDGKTLFTIPRMAFLRNILLNHNYHHRGQLTVYLRLLDIPVPSVYGPSADENPFA